MPAWSWCSDWAQCCYLITAGKAQDPMDPRLAPYAWYTLFQGLLLVAASRDPTGGTVFCPSVLLAEGKGVCQGVPHWCHPVDGGW